MDREQEVCQAHDMLDRLGAPGKRGQGSIRERLFYMLRDHREGKPLPTQEQCTWAMEGPLPREDT